MSSGHRRASPAPLLSPTLTALQRFALAALLLVTSCGPIFRGPAEPVVVHAEPDAFYAVEQPGWFQVLMPSNPVVGRLESQQGEQTLSFTTLRGAGYGYSVSLFYGEMQRLNEFREEPEVFLRDRWRVLAARLMELGNETREVTPRYARLSVEAILPPNSRMNPTRYFVRGVVQVLVTRSRVVIAVIARNPTIAPSLAFQRSVASLRIATP